MPVAEYAALAKQGKLQQVIERWLQHPMMWLGDNHQREERLLRSILEQYSGVDLIEFDADSYVFRHDVLSALAAFPRPTLLLTGAKETVSRRKQAYELMRRIPNCRELVFKNSGHLSNLTEPALYNQAVTEFCGRADTGIPESRSSALD